MFYKMYGANGGGLIKTTSWEEAKTNAKSIVIAVGDFSAGSYTRTVNVLIKKEDIGRSKFATTGFYFSSTVNGGAQIYLNTDLSTYPQGSFSITFAGTTATVLDTTYYYDV